jgi:hypothetical protein
MDHSEGETAVSRLGNYSEPDYRPVHPRRRNRGHFPVELVLKDAACPAAATLSNALA